ncbi:MAG: DUF1553 domain-containing protein, partial [Planctomycetota bacterium]
SFDGNPETGRRNTLDFKRGLQTPYINLPSDSQSEQLAAVEKKIAAVKKQLQEMRAGMEAKDDTEAKNGAEKNDVAKNAAERKQKLQASLKELQRKRDALLQQIPAALVMRDRQTPRPTHILIRGQYDAPGERVVRDTPGFLPPLRPANEIATRMDLANWLVREDHPLTARVAVNRFWQHLFGVGLVKTSEDFGAQGDVPSHPQLLDYLADRFMRSGWDVKSLIRHLVTSQTYRQSSRASADAFRDDPDNRWLARGGRHRLDAESIRDSVLHAAGLLNLTMFGRSVRPPQPDGIWESVVMPSSFPRVYKTDSGDKQFRRSVYTFWKRAIPPPQMTIFDAPTRESCIARRERTNTPLQALVMMNEPAYFAAAMTLAGDLLMDENLDDDARILSAHRRLLGRVPGPQRLAILRTGLEDFHQDFIAAPAAAESMRQRFGSMLNLRDNPPTDGFDERLAAWTMLIHSLLNLDEFRTRS